MFRIAVYTCILIFSAKVHAFRANIGFWQMPTSSCPAISPWNSKVGNWLTTNTHSYSNQTWTTFSNALPGNISQARVAVVGDYIYLYGGHNGSSDGQTNAIHRAPKSDPSTWTKLTPTLPSKLWQSHIAIIGDYIYLFGGRTGQSNSSTTNAIYRAPISDPTSWTTTGAT